MADASELESQVLKEVMKLKLSPSEVQKILKNLQHFNPRQYMPMKINITDKHIKYGAFADAHMGHICYRPDIMEHMAKHFKKEGVEFVVNAGDTIEGMSGRDGHIYELTHLGASNQMNYFAEEMKKLSGLKVFSIEADSSHGGWFKSKGNMGLDIGPELEARAKDIYKFIGYDEQDLQLDNGLTIRLRHPGGGTAYALSYKMQKYIDGISGGNKPHILHQGHFHKAIYLFYRNIHCIDSGTLAEQTPFMKKIGTPAHLGYWIVDVNFKNPKKGVEKIDPKFIPFYD